MTTLISVRHIYKKPLKKSRDPSFDHFQIYGRKAHSEHISVLFRGVRKNKHDRMSLHGGAFSLFEWRNRNNVNVTFYRLFKL